jgi:O-antigen ligase
LRKLERFLRFLLFIPAFLLMRRDGLPCGRTFAAGFLVAAPLLFAQGQFQTSSPKFLFKVQDDLKEGPTEGQVPENLRKEFQEHGVSLSAGAQVVAAPDPYTAAIWDRSDSYLLMRREGDVQVYTGFYRARGAYNAILFGDFCVYVMSVIGAWLVCVARRRLEYKVGLCGVMLSLYASLLSGARGAWICLPVLVLFSLALYARRLRERHWVLAGGGLLAVCLLVPLLVPDIVKLRLFYLKKALSSPTQVASVRERLEMWKACLVILKRSPLLGTGLGDLKTDLRDLMDQGVVDLPWAYDHAHSIYFDMLARAGLVGTAGLVVFVFVLPFRAFFMAWRRRPSNWVEFSALAGMLTVVSFAVFGLTEAWFSRMPLVTAYVVCLMTFLASTANEIELAESQCADTGKP